VQFDAVVAIMRHDTRLNFSAGVVCFNQPWNSPSIWVVVWDSMRCVLRVLALGWVANVCVVHYKAWGMHMQSLHQLCAFNKRAKLPWKS
jgi:hypothetical protein